MSDKITEYKERKRIEAEGILMMWVVQSTREGVKEPVEIPVKETRDQKMTISKKEGSVWVTKEVNTKVYKFETSPSTITIVDGETSGSEESYFSGFGDLWVSKDYGTFDKADAEAYFIKETKRVTDKYFKNVLVISSPDGDWEGLYFNGKLIDEAHSLGEGQDLAIYWLQKSEEYGFKSSDIRYASVKENTVDSEYLESVGTFPNDINDLKEKY